MFRPALLLLFSVAVSQAEPAGWPREFRVRKAPVVTATDPDYGLPVARTRHFRILSEAKVSQPDLERFATVVESVPQLLEQIPLPLWAPPADENITILLCRDEASFQRAGGNRGAVGWYDGKTRRVLIVADYFLRPPSLRPTRLQPRPNQDLLVHELVHLGMHGLLWRLPPWISEGTAEYFAVCHRGNGWYTFHDVEAGIRDHLRKSLTVNPDGSYTLLPVGQILALNGAGWLDTAQDAFSGNPYLPYATALLLAHYHFHGGKERRARLVTHLETVRTLRPREKTPRLEMEDDPAEIERRLAAFWRPKGLNLKFARP